MSNNNPMRVITGKVRLSYANVWEPREQPSGDERYSACILIPKEDNETLEKIETAINHAIQEGSGKLWGGKSKGLKIPLRDGDDEDDRGDRGDEFLGHYFINANSKREPGIVDRYNIRINDEDEVYSGCYVRVSINFYPFQAEGNKGVACGLNNIQKLTDGEPLFDMGVAAEDEFDVYVEGGDTKPVRNKENADNSSKQNYTAEEIQNGKGDLPFGKEDEIAFKINRSKAA